MTIITKRFANSGITNSKHPNRPDKYFIKGLKRELQPDERLATPDNASSVRA